jgi:hypothetical protein
MVQTVCPILNAKFARFEVLSTFDEDSGLLGYYAVSKDACLHFETS